MQTPEVVRRAWPWLLVYLAVVLAHLAGQLVEVGWLRVATKPLLLPVLLVWFVRVTPGGWLRVWVALGLAASWVGDVLLMPSGDGWFLAGLAAFLVAQSAYCVGFVRDLGRSIIRRRPLATIPYVAVLFGLVGWLAPDLGGLLVPVAVYALVIVAMAVLATGISVTVALGAVLFVVSDALIALTSLADRVELPASGFWVMLTYTAGQALIAIGVASRARTDRRAAEAAEAG